MTQQTQMHAPGHTFIQASAGTGKTYQIEQLVVNMIADEGYELSQILIVTFTEKATGELRRRVRQRLEARLREAEAGRVCKHPNLLRSGLDNFDDAAIFTIHGFCQRILTEYAFETGQPFRVQLLDDPQLLGRLFARGLRTTWPGKLLSPEVDPLGCKQAYNEDFYRETVSRVAPNVMPGDVLIPDPAGNSSPVSSQLENVVRTMCAPPLLGHSVRLTAGAVPGAQSVAEQLALEMGAFKDPNAPKKGAIGHVKDVAKGYAWLAAQVVGWDTALQGGKTLWECPPWESKARFETAVPALVRLGYLSEAQADAVLELSALAQLQTTQQGYITARAIQDVKDNLERHKRQSGQIDYNDLLLHLRDALRRENSPLIPVLRQRYRCALVDEFQDTDQVQWEIFRRVFLESKDHRLIVVGDPKQAIYSFRGANVHAYLDARKQFAGTPIELPINFRSYPPLLKALNAVFAEGWLDGAIDYKPVQEPEAHLLRARLFQDKSGRPPLCLVRPPGKTQASTFRSLYARFVVQEIEHLLNSQIQIGVKQGSTQMRRPLNASDICILVRTRGEFPVLRRALQKAQIPYSFAKITAIFGSQEALEWRYLLRAVRAPQDARAVMKALLTRFFACPSEDVEGFAALPAGHPLPQLLHGWHLLAQKRDWGKLLRSVLQDSGVLLRAMAGEDGDRSVTNFQHLAQLLHEQATRQSSTLADLIKYLDAQVLLNDNEKNLQRLETEEPRVQVMTIHAAKGLEFPVVFLAGGFTGGNRASNYFSYLTATHRVYAFDKNAPAKEEQEVQEGQEARRLFYVALTRAQYKLYLPYFPEPAKSDAKAPLSNFVAQALGAILPQAGSLGVGELQLNDQGQLIAPLTPWPNPGPPPANVSLLPEAKSSLEAADLPPGPPALPDLKGRRRTRTSSFSSLAKFGGTTHSEAPTYTPVPQPGLSLSTRELEDDDEAEVEEVDNTDLPVGTPDLGEWLPRGADTGSLLHEVLENLDYSRVSNMDGEQELLHEGSPERQLIEAKVNRYLGRRLEQREVDLQAVAQLVWRALRTPMEFLGGATLARVAQRRHELEFWLPVRGKTQADNDLPSIERGPGFLSGFIDLIFLHDGRYFILDWKSNAQTEKDYSRPGLEAIMTAHQYDLQYKIYALALDKILRLSVQNYDPAMQLGGVCYLFLRGVNPAVPAQGVYFVPGAQLDLALFQQTLESRLGQTLEEGNTP